MRFFKVQLSAESQKFFPPSTLEFMHIDIVGWKQHKHFYFYCFRDVEVYANKKTEQRIRLPTAYYRQFQLKCWAGRGKK
jgi:hypothetical protein